MPNTVHYTHTQPTRLNTTVESRAELNSQLVHGGFGREIEN